MVTVAIINESTKMTDAQVAPIVQALQVQVSRDFAPIWHTDATVVQSTLKTVDPNAWVLGLFDTSDQAGALGYHDITPKGLPLGKAFVGTDIQYGASPSVTMSHELLEMLGDPEIDTVIQTGASTFYAYENCDAVEADGLGYNIAINGVNVLVSDFVTPAWFRPHMPGPYSFRQSVKKALTLAKGGYISIWTPSKGWTQKTAADYVPSHLDRARVGSRRERRLVGRDVFVTSTY